MKSILKKLNSFTVILIFFVSTWSSCSSLNGRSVTTTEIVYRSAEFQVNVAKYSGINPSTKSLLILPPTGGENFIDRSYAQDFSKLGYDVYILQSWTGMDERSSTKPEKNSTKNTFFHKKATIIGSQKHQGQANKSQ